jgi:hypothetical protein
LRPRQGIQKTACRFKLPLARPLREIAGYGDNVGGQLPDRVEKRANQSIADAAEMKVG